jgi:hypothetical protein
MESRTNVAVAPDMSIAFELESPIKELIKIIPNKK